LLRYGTHMDDHLAYFLDLRVRLRGRPEAVALVDRCLRIIAEGEDGSPDTRERLAREVEALRRELVARHGPKSPLKMH